MRRSRQVFNSLVRLGAVLAVCTLVLAAPQKKNKNEPTTRNVQGTVTDADGKSITGAVVQLKDTRSMQVRSFISQDGGAYHFSSLKMDYDYELKADYNGMTSGWKRLTVFDTRTEPVINLKMDKKQEQEK